METKYFTPNTPSLFVCNNCNFKCSKNSDWDRHLSTAKHNRLINTNDFTPEHNYTCKCGKMYKHMSSLCSHKKKCSYNSSIIIDGINIKDKDALVLHLLKQNCELHDKIINMNTNTQSSITNINNNSHNTTNIDNKTFNLNFFLNETCKDAMNIGDFVSSIKVSLSDLENTGKQGYIEGISKIVLKNLNNVEQSMRPIHCSDVKREVFYIKDNNEWQKENEEKPILTKAIKVIANENIKQIKHWRDKYPDCTDSDSKKNNLYLKIVSNSMNGFTQEESNKNIDKIISNVAKEVTIDKANVL
jgi:hypothetical protein